MRAVFLGFATLFLAAQAPAPAYGALGLGPGTTGSGDTAGVGGTPGMALQALMGTGVMGG